MFKGLGKLLFGGGEESGDPNGAYYYVRVYRKPNRPTDSDEIVQIRIDLRNDLSPDMDNPQVFFSRKSITGPKTFTRTEARFFYDKNRNLISSEVDNGEFVSKEDYDAYLETATAEYEHEEDETS
jgi:hypothetical protein